MKRLVVHIIAGDQNGKGWKGLCNFGRCRPDNLEKQHNLYSN